jgi:hypothetical protein
MVNTWFQREEGERDLACFFEIQSKKSQTRK